jgi:hypothetical protein
MEFELDITIFDRKPPALLMSTHETLPFRIPARSASKFYNRTRLTRWRFELVLRPLPGAFLDGRLSVRSNAV